MVCYGEVRRKHNRSYLPSAFYLFCTSILLQAAQAQSAVGCADGSGEGILGNGSVVACEGHWFGHVRRAHSLCAFGWKLCSWQDGKVLRNVTWEDAMTVDGCYVYDASQDGGQCRECRDSLQRDDMAGVGKGCPYQNKGHVSCISGGRIDASCCVDSHFRRACSFIPGLTSGVLCCKSPDRAPRIVVKPRDQLHVFSGHIFLVSCQATGSPEPRTHWYKDGKRLPHNNSRLSVLKSGDLLVTLARSGDSGLYTCEVINSQGVDTATSHVIVTDYQSGCSDGSTEGLLRHRDIHACAGRWSGHVKRARRLCAKGWAVCNPKDKGTIAKLSWPDIMGLKGCYALNIANTGSGCNRCYSKKMAGVGKKCSRIRLHRNSCFTKGRIDVYEPRHSTCDFQEGQVTGTLCCRRKSRRQHVKPKWSCDPVCQNGGRCVGQNRCQCKPGYKGVSCQNAICSPACEFGFVCEKPDQCTCPPGPRGNMCRKTIKQLCVSPCLNGGRCKKGRCKCPPTHWGRTCAHELHRLFLTDSNRTER